MTTPDGVHRFGSCRIEVDADAWAFASANATLIDQHWTRRLAENPAMFNGVIYVMRSWRGAGDRFEASLVRTDFKSYLFWRDSGFPAVGVRDAFGSALIRSADGHVMLGRQREGHINAGLAYLPGGFIDHRDVTGNGTIDIDASIAREMAEETGLDGRTVVRDPGYLVTFAGPLVSIAREYRSTLSAAALVEAVRAHIAADADPELADVVAIATCADLEGLAVPDYARALLATVLGD